MMSVHWLNLQLTIHKPGWLYKPRHGRCISFSLINIRGDVVSDLKVIERARRRFTKCYDHTACVYQLACWLIILSQRGDLNPPNKTIAPNTHAPCSFRSSPPQQMTHLIVSLSLSSLVNVFVMCCDFMFLFCLSSSFQLQQMDVFFFLQIHVITGLQPAECYVNVCTKTSRYIQ